jgi:hypothetical protein
MIPQRTAAVVVTFLSAIMYLLNTSKARARPGLETLAASRDPRDPRNVVFSVISSSCRGTTVVRLFKSFTQARTLESTPADFFLIYVPIFGQNNDLEIHRDVVEVVAYYNSGQHCKQLGSCIGDRFHIHQLPFCELCNRTGTFVYPLVNWAQYEGWKGMLHLLDRMSSDGNEYEQVLWVEAYDVFFQTDPFKLLQEYSGSLLYSTSPYTTFSTDFWVSDSWYFGSQFSIAYASRGNQEVATFLRDACRNRNDCRVSGAQDEIYLSGDSYTDCCGELFRTHCKSELCKSRPSVNSGILLGTFDVVHEIVRGLVRVSYEDFIVPRCCWDASSCLLKKWMTNFSNDAIDIGMKACAIPFGQSVLNYHLMKFDYRYNPSKLQFPFTSPLCSVGTFAMPLDAIGHVLTDVNGRLCSVVHMFNRFNYWKSVADPHKVNMITHVDEIFEFVESDKRLLLPYDGIERYGIAQWVVDTLCDQFNVSQFMCTTPGYSRRCHNGTTEPVGRLQCLRLDVLE